MGGAVGFALGRNPPAHLKSRLNIQWGLESPPGDPMEMAGLLSKHEPCLGKVLGQSVPSCHIEYGTSGFSYCFCLAFGLLKIPQLCCEQSLAVELFWKNLLLLFVPPIPPQDFGQFICTLLSVSSKGSYLNSAARDSEVYKTNFCVGSWIHPASISRPTFLLGKKWDVLWPSWSHMVWDFF